jgi:lipopolysaccharide transport system ATP-binding protein
MSAVSIRTDKLGKRYSIGERQPYGTLRDAISAGALIPWRRRASAMSTGKAEDEEIWALRDVSIEVTEGEVVGIVGPNGSGKSTLLKILSRITEPTEGSAVIRGRAGSLLEVGTGFHGELTGRENIFLNGSILGMKRAEIRRKLDEIVEFAEIGKFLDTPVKHYSSGMYVRLAFAVAAHVDLDILMVDEVLAVGDAAFQRKCLGRMDEAAHQGRTVFFVTHNMSAINQLCTRALLLTDGRIQLDGRPEAVAAEYLQRTRLGAGEVRWAPGDAPGGDLVRLDAVRVRSDGAITSEPRIDREITIEVDFSMLKPGGKALAANIYLLDAYGNTVLSSANIPGASPIPDAWFGKSHDAGTYRSACTLPANLLNDLSYYVTVHVVRIDDVTVEATASQALSFTVMDTGGMREGGRVGDWYGAVRPMLAWRTEELDENLDDPGVVPTAHHHVA